MKFLDLSMKMKAANSKDCQRLLLCQLNGQVSGQSLNNWHLGQVCSLGLAKMASGSHTASMQNMVIRVIKFSREGYRIRYIWQKNIYSLKQMIAFCTQAQNRVVKNWASFQKINSDQKYISLTFGQKSIYLRITSTSARY